MGYAEVRLPSGDVFTVEGALDEVESKRSDAARSGQARLAWFKEQGTESSVGINPAHVAALRASEASTERLATSETVASARPAEFENHVIA